MIVVHIGLGKTATTTLQRNVYPKFCEYAHYEFNPPEVICLLKRGLMTYFDGELLAEIKSHIIGRDLFISLESLLSWNPYYWPKSIDNPIIYSDPTYQ